MHLGQDAVRVQWVGAVTELATEASARIWNAVKGTWGGVPKAPKMHPICFGSIIPNWFRFSGPGSAKFWRKYSDRIGEAEQENLEALQPSRNHTAPSHTPSSKALHPKVHFSFYVFLQFYPLLYSCKMLFELRSIFFAVPTFKNWEVYSIHHRSLYYNKPKDIQWVPNINLHSSFYFL